MNAAVLVSNLVNRKKSWKQAAEVLEHFWTDEAKEEEKEDEKKGGLSSNPDICRWLLDKDNKPKIFNASPETVRKYYSVKQYFFGGAGAPNFFNPKGLEDDSRFQDNDVLGNRWPVYSSKLLEQTIKRYSQAKGDEKNDDDLRIATSWDKREPRLLVISLDVSEGKTVAFDSYHREAEDPGNSLYDRANGITINHVMASGTLPELYKFRDIPKEGGRKFCDGGILSNTPFRELLQAHRDYWKMVLCKDQHIIPDLDVYIINVHPSKQHTVPAEDRDSVKDRINDITYSDRNSHYDEMVADLVTDFKDLLTDHTELIDNLKELAKRHLENKDQCNTTFQDEFEDILKATEEKRRRVTVGDTKYKDLIKGRFKVTVTRIENEGYEDSIYGKGADSTSKTIEALIAKGKEDAQRVLNSNKGNA
ncbi:MAG TPA: patatin-like phospholipase family protein, partial [Nitrososphaera sp.]|nr:patatin-like phospholipase family protein [Nitrososphaera sp.]